MEHGKSILDTSPKIGVPIADLPGTDIAAELSHAASVLSNTQKNIKAGIGLQIGAAEQTVSDIASANLDYVKANLGAATATFQNMRALLGGHISTHLNAALDTYKRLAEMVAPAKPIGAVGNPVTVTVDMPPPIPGPIPKAATSPPSCMYPPLPDDASDFAKMLFFTSSAGDGNFGTQNAVITPRGGGRPVDASTIPYPLFNLHRPNGRYWFSWALTPATIAMIPLDGAGTEQTFGSITDLYLNDGCQTLPADPGGLADMMRLDIGWLSSDWTMLTIQEVANAIGTGYGPGDAFQFWLTASCMDCGSNPPPVTPPAGGGGGPPIVPCGPGFWLIAWPITCDPQFEWRIESTLPNAFYFAAIGPFPDAQLLGSFVASQLGIRPVNWLANSASLVWSLQDGTYQGIADPIDTFIASGAPMPPWGNVSPFTIGDGSPPFDPCTCASFPWTGRGTNNCGVVTYDTWSFDCGGPVPSPQPGPGTVPPVGGGPPSPTPGPMPIGCPPAPPCPIIPYPVPGTMPPPCPPPVVNCPAPVINVLPCGSGSIGDGGSGGDGGGSNGGNGGSSSASATGENWLEWIMSEDSDAAVLDLEEWNGDLWVTLGAAATLADAVDFKLQASRAY